MESRDCNERIDSRWNLLEENDYSFSFQNVEEPQLFRDMFDYDNVPKITFNHRLVPMRMPDNIWITDTTFRDGQQARTPFTVKQIVDLYTMLHKLGGPKGVTGRDFVPSVCPQRASPSPLPPIMPTFASAIVIVSFLLLCQLGHFVYPAIQ